MPRRPLPVFALSLALGIALFALVRPAPAQPRPDPAPADDPAQFPRVEVSPADGGKAIEGRLKLSAVTLKTDTGSTTILMSRVRRITFQKDPEGNAQDTVQLADRSMVRGRVTAELFEVEIGGGEAKLKKSDIHEIRVLNAVPVSLVAVLLGLLTLTLMEVILGVDNVIFLAVVVGKLPKERQPPARKLGLAAALGTRILLLLFLSFLLGLTAPIFTLPSLGILHDAEAREISWRDIILLAGGLFLIGKSVMEIHEKLEHARREHSGEGGAATVKPASFGWTIFTIAVMDIIFSLDSVVTAIGMVEQVWVMIVAMVIAMLVMLYFAGPIGDFVNRHPTVKVLALSFLILIGVMLVAEGMGQHIDKGYIYAAMAFAVVVEMMNMQLRKPKKVAPVA
jgi:predicted tellurium resistance membrane protein TerC